MKRKSIALAVLLVAVTGCDKSSLNNANLKDGLNHALTQNAFCIGPTDRDFPQTMYDNNGAQGPSLMDLLASHGLVTKSTAAPGGAGQSRSTYTLTAAGRDTAFKGLLRPGESPRMFCVGTKQVDEITNYEMPDPSHHVRVFYTWKMTDVPSWAKDPQLQKATNFMTQLLGPDPTGMVHRAQGQLAQTDKGWRVEGDM